LITTEQECEEIAERLNEAFLVRRKAGCPALR
jgi:hypothetical protein